MTKFNLFYLIFATLFYQLDLADSSCTEVKETSGSISDSLSVSDSGGLYHRCWIIENRDENSILVELNTLVLLNRPASDGNLTIELKSESKVLDYWSQSQMESFTTKSSVKIQFNVNKSKFSKNLGTSFSLKYKQVCGQNYTGSRGYISSPNYPAKYPADTQCTYFIRVNPGFIIDLTFQKLEMENHTTCNFDYLQIFDGENKDSPLIAKVCGNTLPASITSNYHTLRLKFRSDRSNEFVGFHVTYNAVEMAYHDCRRKESFHCFTDVCVPKYDVCNGVQNCANGADEMNCAYKYCNGTESFHCTNDTCIPKGKVCDGTEDCENGTDELGCGIPRIKGVDVALKKEIAWLTSKRSSSWGWRDHTPRAIVALFLAGGARFDGQNLEEEVMAKHTELKISIAFLKKSLSNEQLSMYINGLLVTCHNPRHFYGQNLIKRLKDQVQSSHNFTHPTAYLTLCNAKESWPFKAIGDLDKILITDSNYPFIRDYQSVAVMAVSCFKNQTNLLHEYTSLKLHYESAIQKFKQMQNPDGSFGNLHTTAVITQALLSSGHEFSKDWNLNATLQYLMQKLASPHDLLASYLTLPVLNAKSFSDVAKVNCTTNPRRSGYANLTSEIVDYAGPKMRIQYSLYVGDEIDVIHTISLRVPENYSAYDVMELAKTEDNKFNFKYESISGMMYVYEINGVTNDLEAGLFWLLYQGLTNVTNSLVHYNFSPDQLVMQDKEHLVMWYKKAHF